MKRLRQDGTNSAYKPSSYLSLPDELKVELNRDLSLAQCRKLQLVNRENLSRGWLYRSIILRLEPGLFLSIPTAQLASLRILHFSHPNQDSASVLSRLGDLPRLEMLRFEGLVGADFDFASLRLPPSLVFLQFEISNDIVPDGSAIFNYLCKNHPGLTDLSLNLSLPCPKLLPPFSAPSPHKSLFPDSTFLEGISKLKKLELLAMDGVTGVPSAPEEILPALRANLPANVNLEELRIGWLCADQVFGGHKEPVVEELRQFYNFGFRIPDPAQIFFVNPQRFKAYLAEGWIEVEERLLLSTMYLVDSVGHFKVWRDHLPSTQNSVPSSATTPFAGMIDAVVAGVKYSALIFAGPEFLSELLADPDSIYFDLDFKYSGKPITYFIKDPQMQMGLADRGHYLAEDETEPAVDFGRELYWASDHYMRGVSEIGLDLAWYFVRCHERPSYFKTHYKEIIHSCFSQNETAGSTAGMIGHLLDRDCDYLRLAMEACITPKETLTLLLSDDGPQGARDRYNHWLVQTIFACGANNFMQASFDMGLLETPITFSGNILHFLGSNYIPSGEEIGQGVQLFDALLTLPLDSPLLHAPDHIENYPIYYWIQVALRVPILKFSIHELIRHFGIDLAVLDCEGKHRLRPHLLASAAHAGKDFVRQLEEKGHPTDSSALDVFSQSWDPNETDLEQFGKAVMEAYRRLAEQLFPGIKYIPFEGEEEWT